MSITINQQPSLYTPVYNPMRFVVTSSNTAQPNFKYVVDIYVSGVTGFTRLVYNADPNSGKSYPDIKEVVGNYISYDLSHTTYNFQQCTNSLKAYEVKFGEQYGPSSGIVTYPNITVTGTKYAWNGCLDPLTFQSFDYTRYLVGSLAYDFLTFRPTTNYYSTYSENDSLYFINATSGTAYFGVFETFDSNGNSLAKWKVQNAYQASNIVDDKLLRIAVGTEDVQNNTSIFISGNPAHLNIGESYYTFKLTDFFGNDTSNTYYFYKECTSKYGDPIIMRFLNRLGGFDKFNFRLVRKYSSDIKRDSFQKNLGTASGATWGYTDMDRGETVYNTEITDKLKAESDWINDAQSTWLQELVESPECYYHLGTAGGRLIPVIVSLSNYDIKSIAADKLFNLTIDVRYANKRTAQKS